MSSIFLFKALHIVGFVAWFGGLFYLVRIFVYHREARDKSAAEQAVLLPQYALMEKRAYSIICNPAMMITWTCGLVMLHLYGTEWFKTNSWMHIKLLLLILLTGYHIWCKRIMKRMAAGEPGFTSFQFRLFNEVPTLFLLSITLLAVYRNTLNFAMAFGGVVLFGVVMYVGARMYKQMRSKSQNLS